MKRKIWWYSRQGMLDRLHYLRRLLDAGRVTLVRGLLDVWWYDFRSIPRSTRYGWRKRRRAK